MYDSTKIARVVSNHTPVGTHSLYLVWDVRSFARFWHLFAPICARFALFCARFVDDSSQTRPVKEYETTELDFCSNPTKCSKAIVEENMLQRVNLCINQGGGIICCYDGGSRQCLTLAQPEKNSDRVPSPPPCRASVGKDTALQLTGDV